MRICTTHMGHTCHSYVPVPTVLVIIFIITVILYRRNEECGKGDEEDLSWFQEVGSN